MRMEQKLTAQSQRRQGLVPNNSARSLTHNMETSLPPELRPGNVGKLFDVIWPFWLSFPAYTLAPGATQTEIVQVTHEAAFIWTGITRVAYVGAGTSAPYQCLSDLTTTPVYNLNVNMQMKDLTYSKFYQDKPVSLDSFGSQGVTTQLPTPHLLMPNQRIEAKLDSFSNDVDNPGEDLSYFIYVILTGYRIRIQDANRYLSLSQQRKAS
jgi:hypothetical protein